MTNSQTETTTCELCGDGPAETLTSDSHPEGPNYVVCEACAL